MFGVADWGCWRVKQDSVSQVSLNSDSMQEPILPSCAACEQSYFLILPVSQDLMMSTLT